MQEGVTNPSPASLKDVVFCRLLSRSLPQFLVADGVRPVNLENPFEKGVDECLEFLHVRGSGSPGLGSIESDRLHDGVEDPDLGVGAQICGSPDIL